MTGATAMPSAAVTTSARKSKVAVRSITPRTSSAEFLFFCSARTGTKACEKAPSANRRRSRLGRRKATKKASVAIPAPKARAMKKSRAKPRMRLTNVRPLTVTRARRRFMLKFAPFPGQRVHGKHQIRAQARAPGAGAPRAQHEPAHRGAHGDQEREEGSRGRRQGGRGHRAARLAARHRPRGGERRDASECGRPPQEPPRARAQEPEVTRSSSASLVRSATRPSRT